MVEPTYSAIKLVMACPGQNCPKQTAISGWVHSSCTGDIYLRGDGYLICIKCLTNDHMCDWRFACANHAGKYEKPNYNSLMLALGTAATSIESGFSNKLEGLKFMAGVQMSIFKKQNSL